jgi:uncharacterized protein YndB with AHSA1/START domain
MSSVIRQELTLPANPQRVYRALTDARQFSEATGDAAEIGAGNGDAFSCFGGRITGRHLEMIPNERLVQAWRSRSWDPGFYSIVRFELEPAGDGTRVSFSQRGFPEGEFDHLSLGWQKMYWDKLGAYLAERWESAAGSRPARGSAEG